MSTILTINNQVITFPTSGTNPDWSSAVDQFAVAVAEALGSVVNPGDVFPQAFSINSFNSASNIPIPALSFPTSTVLAVFIHYAVYRTTSSANASEAGDIILLYNPNNGTGLKWTLSQGNITGVGAQINFNVTDGGQVQFSTTALSGSGHQGVISFDARALPNGGL
jgi:hypothetical protein